MGKCKGCGDELEDGFEFCTSTCHHKYDEKKGVKFENKWSPAEYRANVAAGQRDQIFRAIDGLK
ncbi:hypothetical protein [Desulfobacula sp.]|uniref:hypothetical protein n=1 Tax=Desulfobacula sp. TaxID=2593537 RepID=UPI00261D3AC1|nr:hypothetical protein [Desulfobacula sp.]